MKSDITTEVQIILTEEIITEALRPFFEKGTPFPVSEFHICSNERDELIAHFKIHGATPAEVRNRATAAYVAQIIRDAQQNSKH